MQKEVIIGLIILVLGLFGAWLQSYWRKGLMPYILTIILAIGALIVVYCHHWRILGILAIILAIGGFLANYARTPSRRICHILREAIIFIAILSALFFVGWSQTLIFDAIKVEVLRFYTFVDVKDQVVSRVLDTAWNAIAERLLPVEPQVKASASEEPGPRPDPGKEASDSLWDYSDKIDTTLDILRNLSGKMDRMDSVQQAHIKKTDSTRQVHEAMLKNLERRMDELEGKADSSRESRESIMPEYQNKKQETDEAKGAPKDPNDGQAKEHENDTANKLLGSDAQDHDNLQKEHGDVGIEGVRHGDLRSQGANSTSESPQKQECARLKKPIEFWNWKHTKPEPFVTIDFKCEGADTFRSYTADSTATAWDAEIPTCNGKVLYKLRKGDVDLMGWSEWEPVSQSAVIRAYPQKWEIRLPHGV